VLTLAGDYGGKRAGVDECIEGKAGGSPAAGGIRFVPAGGPAERGVDAASRAGNAPAAGGTAGGSMITDTLVGTAPNAGVGSEALLTTKPLAAGAAASNVGALAAEDTTLTSAVLVEIASKRTAPAVAISVASWPFGVTLVSAASRPRLADNEPIGDGMPAQAKRTALLQLSAERPAN